MKRADGGLPLLKGTVDMLVLKALSWRPTHGFGITLWLEEQSGGALDLDDSMIYQVLHRLEGRGYITAAWKTTEHNRRARYYTITRRGRSFLEEATGAWLRYSSSVTAIMTLTTQPTAS